MISLVEPAFRGAEIAYQICEGMDRAEDLGDFVIDYMNGGGFKIVDLLYEFCRDAVLDPQGMSDRSKDDQAAIWRALGILETAIHMPIFWEQQLAEAAFNSAEERAQAPPNEFDALFNSLND